MRRLPLLAALVFAGGSAHGETAKKAPEPRELVSTTAVELAGMPVFEVPPPLKDATQPPSANEATGLVIGAAPGDVEKWRKNPIAPTSFLVKGESLAFSIVLSTASNQAPRDSVWVSCDARAARRFQALRWETFAVDPQGNATWAIHDGFLDTRACRVLDQRTTEVHPKAVATFGDHAIAFAARSDDGVTFFLPSTDALAGDGVGARLVRGSLPRVSIPIAKGGSASAVAFVDAARLAGWLGALGVKDESVRQRFPRGVTVRIDATQTVSEDAPTVIVRTSASS